MAAGDFRKYDITALAGDAVRVVYAPYPGSTIPAKLDDVMGLVDPYTLKGTSPNTWKDFGATSDDTTYGRNMDQEEWEIHQVQGAIIRRLTNVTRQIKLTVAEIKPETLQIIENASSIVSIPVGAAASGTPAQSAVDAGPIPSLTPYRVAFVGQRPVEAGTVTETGGLTRGHFFGYVAYRATLTADNVEFGFGKGNLASADITFDLYPESAAPANGNTGRWLFETGATIP